MPSQIFGKCWHSNMTPFHATKTHASARRRFVKPSRYESRQKICRGQVSAMADVLVSLHEQALLIKTTGFTSKAAFVAVLSVMFAPWCHSFIISAVACKLALPFLSALGQPIRSTGPSSHLSKTGTPTAAGCIFLPVACAVTCAHIPTARVMCACAFILTASAVGIVDDYLTVNPPSLDRRGLSAQQQLIIQIVSGLLLATVTPTVMPQNLISTASTGAMAAVHVSIFPWLSIAISPVIYQLLCAFTYVSEVNAVNLTDGLDGLAATCTALVLSGAGMGLHASGCQDLQALCASLSGAVCGFYTHNRHPAAAFMGNCGSHGLGAAIAAVAAFGGAHGIVGLLSTLLAVEAASTAVQLGWFSWTQRWFGQGLRLLRMAPLHHHLEMCGWHEVAVVAMAAAGQVALVMLVAGMWW